MPPRAQKKIKPPCSHLGQIQEVAPSSNGCEACRAVGDTWVHLRLCMICGNVACCDDSKNRHASKHAQAARHPVIMSFEPDEDWLFCFPDRVGIMFDHE